MTLRTLREYSNELKEDFPLHCGNLSVAAQYLLPLRMIQKYTDPQETTILDWGCGEGHFSYLLMRQKYDVHAYAYEVENVLKVQEKAKSSPNQDWKVKKSDFSDSVTLPYTDQFFDAVISMGVLEHVRETGGSEGGSLSEIHRILKVGGCFFCFHFPNKYSWIEAVCRQLKSCGSSIFAHQYLYTKQDVLKLVEGTTFTMKEIGLYNLLPRRMLHKFSVMDTRGGLYLYGMVEKMLSIFFKNLSQNYYFILQK